MWAVYTKAQVEFATETLIVTHLTYWQVTTAQHLFWPDTCGGLTGCYTLHAKVQQWWAWATTTHPTTIWNLASWPIKLLRHKNTVNSQCNTHKTVHDIWTARGEDAILVTILATWPVSTDSIKLLLPVTCVHHVFLTLIIHPQRSQYFKKGIRKINSTNYLC